ncbi:MAG: prephenate dehydrogenase, partial [Bacteroidales bacterium]
MKQSKTICIIGLGLIGGSMAIDLKKRGFSGHVIGTDVNPVHLETALRRGIIDEALPMEEAVLKAEITVLCTPVSVIRELLPQLLDLTEGSARVITDTGSTKEKIISRVSGHPNRKAYVAAHPMAGTEKSGPEAAFSGLFDNQCVIICEKEESDPAALAVTRELFRTLRMHVTFMDAAPHDLSAAYVSHISHLASFALSLCVQEKEKDQRNIFRLAGGGFSSAVRLAKSPGEMWGPVFEQNNRNIIAVLQAYIDKLEVFKSHLIGKNNLEILELIREANKIQT